MSRETRTCQDRKVYLSKQTNIRRKRLKRKMVNYKGGKCQFCNYSRYLGALDFHHIDPKTRCFGLSTDELYRSWKTIMAELKKCFIVCSNCHREIHAGLIKLPRES